MAQSKDSKKIAMEDEKSKRVYEKYNTNFKVWTLFSGLARLKTFHTSSNVSLVDQYGALLSLIIHFLNAS